VRARPKEATVVEDLHPAHADVDVAAALAESRAAAMGRSGRRLQAAVARYHATATRDEVSMLDDALDDVADATYRLLVQRECAGARSRNLEAIVAAYEVPRRALARI
jgi:hypothetical protein